VKRAGLDYWPHVDLRREKDLEELRGALGGVRFLYFSTKAERTYTDVDYRSGDCLVFGSESRGLPPELLAENREHTLRIPMLTANVRCLNLSSSVAIAVYEALRQIGVFSPERQTP
jgi:tRNA (cytidine/uridine-2'-O-)-methyltransferase